MGLTSKILAFVAVLVLALVGGTLAFSTLQANRLARTTIATGLQETREVWQAIQADRFKTLRLGVRVLANDPHFKAALLETDQATAFDTMRERGQDLKADFVLVTSASGTVIARTDRAGAAGEDLSADPIVKKALEGEESATLWRLSDQLYTAVAVPMQTGGELVGVLVAGYSLNEAAAAQIRRLTHSEIAFFVQGAGRQPRLAVSTLGPREAALSAVSAPELTREEMAPFELNLDGDRMIGVRIPLRTATGEEIGAALALRSLSAETAAFRQFRNNLISVSLGVTAVALLVAWAAAARIAGPVRRLAGLVESARDGSYSGAVSVQSHDEIGVLARAFNALLADLRAKEKLIAYLKVNVSALTAHAASTPAGAPRPLRPDEETLTGSAPTVVAPPVNATLARGQVFASRYEILGIIGKGGMGVVYRARDRQLDETVALKLLRAEALARDPSLLERFKQEIKLARRITHRNVLRTHDFGETDGVPFISMEYLEGVILKDLIRNRGALPLGIGLSLAKQMCEGLGAAHATGVVHRDIKPQNMLIIPETGQLKIMDFGIARVSAMGPEASGLTTAGTVMGTPDYIPPEQAEGKPADFRADIYSLGVVLFEAFTGRLPFKGESSMAIVMAHVRQPPPRPRSLNPRLPVELEAAILRALEKDPARRFSSTQELLAQLSAASAKLEAA